MSEEISTVQAPSFPRLNEPAPDFEAVTTHGVLRLSDYRDSWLILFSHPADFTPVCTTEFIAFTEIYPELQKRGVELLGLSIDSVYSHIAWTRNIEEKMGVKIPFPIIADLDKKSGNPLRDDPARRKQDGNGAGCVYHRSQRDFTGDDLLSAQHRAQHG